MNIYIKPETIIVEMQPTFSMMEGTGVKHNDHLGKQVVSNGAFYSKEDNAWDDWDE